MKSKLILMGVVVVVLLSLVACSSESSLSVQSSVNCDDFLNDQHITGEVEIAVDGVLTVALCSNPTTGFQWAESAQISDQSVLQQADHEYVAPEGEDNEPPAPGTPGEEVWTFNALKKGTSEVSMEYSRPWESGETAEWTYVLTVVVK
ncbi:MAG: protease inhibitor I42 family protein [Dehalococcoidia bacterium]